MMMLSYRKKTNPDPILVQTSPIYRFLWNEVSIEKGSKKLFSVTLPRGISIDTDNEKYNPYKVPFSVKVQRKIVEESKACFIGVETHKDKKNTYLISLDATREPQTDLIDDTGNFTHLGFVQVYSENSGHTPILLYRLGEMNNREDIHAKRTDSFEDYNISSSNLVYDDCLKTHIVSRKEDAIKLFEKKRFSRKLNERDKSKLEELASENALIVCHFDIDDRLIRIVRELNK